LAAAFALVFSAPLALGFIGAAAVTQGVPTQEEHARMLMEQAMPRTAIAYNSRDFDKYAGYYQMTNVTAFITVHRDGSHFFIRLTGPEDKELYPESPTKFFARVVDAQVSFDSDAQGRVTGLVLHQNGWEYTAKKVDDAVARAAEAAEAARFKDQTPDLAREAPLRRFIEASAAGAPPFDIMAPQLADAVRKQQSAHRKAFKEAGAFKSLTFKGVGPGGNDIYVAAFEHINQEWRIGPLTPEGKIYWVAFADEPPSKSAK
jgi:hypothetical protein